MPIYEYEVNGAGGCDICGGSFELRRPADREPLAACPLCQKPVHKVIAQVNTPKVLKPTSVSDAKQAGFTVLKRRDKGTYERL